MRIILQYLETQTSPKFKVCNDITLMVGNNNSLPRLIKGQYNESTTNL